MQDERNKDNVSTKRDFWAACWTPCPVLQTRSPGRAPQSLACLMWAIVVGSSSHLLCRTERDAVMAEGVEDHGGGSESSSTRGREGGRERGWWGALCKTQGQERSLPVEAAHALPLPHTAHTYTRNTRAYSTCTQSEKEAGVGPRSQSSAWTPGPRSGASVTAYSPTEADIS